MPDIPTKRVNPFEKTLNEIRKETVEQKKASTPKTTEEKKTPKKASTKTTTAKKKSSTSTSKKTSSKSAKVKIDPKTGVAIVVEPKTKTKPKATAKTTTSAKKATSKKTTATKSSKPKTKKTTEVKKVQQNVAKVQQDVAKVQQNVAKVQQNVAKVQQNVELTDQTSVEAVVPEIVQTETVVVPQKEVEKKQAVSKTTTSKTAAKTEVRDLKTTPQIVRPAPKKFKLTTKDEKNQYKKLEEAFNYVANLTWVIEERTMNVNEIPDLTLGEVHVVEVVNRNNNKPMTLIAKKLKVTVGSLITCVNRLIQKDYLIRTRDEMDRRVILLSVTPKAKKMLKAHDKFHDDILGLVLENGVTLNQALKVMSQFATTLEQYYDPSTIPTGKEKKVKK